MTLLQTRSHSETVRISTHEFWGDTIQPITPFNEGNDFVVKGTIT